MKLQTALWIIKATDEKECCHQPPVVPCHHCLPHFEQCHIIIRDKVKITIERDTLMMQKENPVVF